MPEPAECGHCHPQPQWGGWIWRDDRWHVGTPATFGIPFWAGLAPNEHVRLHEMGPDLLSSMGAVIQRLAAAIQGLDSVARAHFSRWGDGSAHFHMAFMGRPLGMMQARGYMLPVWDDVLPPCEPELVAASILRQAGCAPDTVLTTPLRGTHPSATVRIGPMLTTDLETEVKGLYVCDASVFPEALGRPTVLTIIALARRLSEHLLERARDRSRPAPSY